METNRNDLIIHVGGDYSLSSHYPYHLKNIGIHGKESILYPLAKLRDLFSHSFTILNLECTLYLDFFEKIDKTDPPVYLCGHPSTNESLIYGQVNAVSLANNHAMDGGGDGLKHTIEALEEQRISYVGVGKTLEEAYAPVFFSYHDYRIAVIAINTIHGASCIDAPMAEEDKGVVVATIVTDESGLKRHRKIMAQSIQQARDQKCDVIMVYYHWGEEHTDRVKRTQILLMKDAAEAGADLVVGTHQHCVQGIKIYETTDRRRVPIAFGLGHVVFGAIPSPREKWSIILEAVFAKDPHSDRMKVTRVTPIPIVTDPSLDQPNAFQPFVITGRDKELLLKVHNYYQLFFYHYIFVLQNLQ